MRVFQSNLNLTSSGKTTIDEFTREFLILIAISQASNGNAFPVVGH
jgi:hypothetical protein